MPILLNADGTSKRLSRRSNVLEDRIQDLVHAHPESLPIADIDPIFIGAVSVCREMQLGNGRVDNFLVTPSGLPVLVECKLWHNPAARRQVVGQILEYAKVLSRWSYSDLQREVAARTGRGSTALLDLVRAADPTVNETTFHDALTFNLRRGRFLLLILGDGIREDVETIVAYLQAHAGLHFTFGLVEFPIYTLANDEMIVVPRVVARTTSIVRTVVEAPVRYEVREPLEAGSAPDADADPERAALGSTQQAFWAEFLAGFLHLDDTSQPVPRPARQGYLSFMFPARQGSSWLTVYRDLAKGEVGVFLSASQNSPGETAMNATIGDWDDVGAALSGTAHLTTDRYGRHRIVDSKPFGDLNQPQVRASAFGWLAERVNTFVNVLRPRIRDALADDAGA